MPLLQLTKHRRRRIKSAGSATLDVHNLCWSGITNPVVLRVFWWGCHSGWPSPVLPLGVHTQDQSSRPVCSHVCMFSIYGMCPVSIAGFNPLSFPNTPSHFHPCNPSTFGLFSSTTRAGPRADGAANSGGVSSDVGSADLPPQHEDHSQRPEGR